jgi:hypothetical protein
MIRPNINIIYQNGDRQRYPKQPRQVLRERIVHGEFKELMYRGTKCPS